MACSRETLGKPSRKSSSESPAARCWIRIFTGTRATGFFYTKHERLCVLHAPHPAVRAMNQPCKEEHLQAAIRKAARLLDAGRM